MKPEYSGSVTDKCRFALYKNNVNTEILYNTGCIVDRFTITNDVYL